VDNFFFFKSPTIQITVKANKVKLVVYISSTTATIINVKYKLQGACCTFVLPVRRIALS